MTWTASAEPLGRRAFLATLAAAAAGCRDRRGTAERVFRVALPYEVDSTDPHRSSTTAAFTVLGNIYEPLVFTLAGKGLRPALAQSWSNTEPLVWVFELRAGVLFHNGRPLHARDVVATLTRVIERQELDVRYYVGDIESVEALDGRRVRLRTRRRTPMLLYKLAHVFIIPEGGEASDGTGPYRIADWQPGRRLVVERHDGHWGAPPSLPKASFDLHVPPGEILRRLAAGEQEMALLGLARPEQALDADGRYAFQRRTGLQVKYLAFDLAGERTPFCDRVPNPFRDRRVRRAFHLGLDRARLVQALPHQASGAGQLVPRQVFGYAPELAVARFDPEQARALLREAGLASGFEATLHTREILREAAETVRDQLAAVGIRLTTRALPDSEYFARLAAGELSLWIDRWSCTTTDSAELFESAMHSRDPKSGFGAFNETGYSNPALDTAIRRALELDVPQERLPALQDLMRRTMEDLPWVPLFTDEEVWAIDRGYVWQPRVDHWLHLADIRRAAG